MKIMHLLAATAIFATAPAAAHNAWIKPSTTTVSGEEGWVGFDIAASTNVFEADHNPMPVEMVTATAPDGSTATLENTMRGRYRSTFDVHLTQPGTWRIGTGGSASVTGSYKLNGEEVRVGGRRGPPPGAAGGGRPAQANFVPGSADFTPPAGATDVKLTLTGSRNEVFVTLGAPSEIKMTGEGLEMQPITHPADLVADEPGQFRFLVDGKPAAGVEIELVPDGRRYRNSQGRITATTDAQGLATINWGDAGLYWLHASFQDESSPRPGITGRRFQYNATLEVMVP